MPRYTQPRKTWEYSVEFKITAVKLSNHDGVRVKQVAESLGIHPFMLSRWRKEYREGKLKGTGARRLILNKSKKMPTPGNLSKLERLERENEKLRLENDLLKKWQRYLAEVHQNDLDSSRDTGK